MFQFISGRTRTGAESPEAFTRRCSKSSCCNAIGMVTAGATLPNPASVHLHEAMGFELVGVYREVGYKLGKWHDVGWYERQLAERVLDPPEPIAFATLANSPEVKAAMARAEGSRQSTLTRWARRS